MKELLHKMISSSERALVMGNVKDMKIYYCNQQMTDLYGVTMETSASFMSIFQEENRILKKILVKQVKKKESSFFYNIVTKKVDGALQLADLRVGYVDRANSVMFMEITPKEDIRMETALSQVDQSARAEGIFHLDEKLTLIHCNEHLYHAFDTTEDKAAVHYENKFSNSFHPDEREHLLAEIHKNLKVSDYFSSKLKVVSTSGEEKWYSMELQKRTLDNSGDDKVMVYMVCIENEVKMEEQLDDINRYFSVLQRIWGGKLYRFDIKNRILYRTGEYAESYNLPVVGEHYPDVAQLEQVIHPKDLQRYLDFIEKVAQGVEGTSEARVKSTYGDYEYHKMTFKSMAKSDGTVDEMVGFAENIHSVRQTEEQLDMVNQYFTALQDLSDDMLYRIDLSTKTLYRTSQQAEIFGLDPVMQNYPQSVLNSGIIHPEDEENYLNYGQELLNGTPSQTEVRMKTNDGEFEYRRLTCSPVYGEGHVVKEMFGKIVNIQMVRELEEQANFDALTQLLNKRAMLEATSDILLCSKPEEKHALFFMDLDDFKYVNDHLGHSFGDFLLSQLGSRLRDGVRQEDLVGRVGGDEFVIFLRNIPNIPMLMGKAKMLLSTISEDFKDGDLHHNIHGSLGIAIFPDHGSGYEELYHHADLALYSSKHKGKNQVTIYSSDMKEK